MTMVDFTQVMHSCCKGEQEEWETSESNGRSETALNYLYTQLNAYVSTHLSIDTNTKYA